MKLATLLFVVATSGTAGAQPTPAPLPPPAATDSPSWLPGVLRWDEPVSAPATGHTVLSLDQAIALALQHQPDLRTAQLAIDVANARIELAHVTLRPTVSLSASASLGSTYYARACGADPTMMCGGFLDPTVSTGLGATANWRITDFGQTRATIRAAEATAAATAAGLTTTQLDIRRNVEAAYLEAVARARIVRVTEATVKSEELHLDQARRLVAAQAKDPIEVAQAQARAANARSALAQAQSNEAIAIANLRAAIGWLDVASSPAVEPTWPAPPTESPPELAALVDTARGHRPELVQLDKQILASDASLAAAYAERRPVLNATASTQWGPRTDDWHPPPSWAVGVSLSWALFDGGRAAADQRIARANLAATFAQRDALLVDLTAQLESARAQIVANQANVAASTEAVAAAQRQLQLADARYAQGLGSQIELADAQTAVTTAEGNLILAQFQLTNAWVSLRRALGQS
ncbi:MAG: TolC family protein [Proteobacteria bacterium]|nr:TolC family protein [Pseudomonadota bacterium]